jgi:hypothetical protein
MVIQRLSVLLEVTQKWIHGPFDVAAVPRKNLIVAKQRMVLSSVWGFRYLSKNGSLCSRQKKLIVQSQNL